jgi:inositol transport system permease protein
MEEDKTVAKRESAVLAFMSKHSILLIFIGLCILIAILSGGIFLRIGNLLNVLRQISVIGIIALGVTMCIITAGIDLSSGAVVAMVAVVVASLVQAPDAMDRLFPGGHPWPIGIVIVIGLLIGLFIGFLNGAMITKLRIPPFIATLGMMTFARGWAFIYSQGRPRGSLTDAFQSLGQGSILGIPNPAIILVLCVLLTYLILGHTLWGRYTYAIGSNLQAAIVSGIKTDRYLLMVYSFAGFLYGIAAIVLTSRIGSGQPGLGLGYAGDFSFEPFAAEVQRLGEKELVAGLKKSIEYLMA